jgi:type II secretory pathway pseudopilin PulG
MPRARILELSDCRSAACKIRRTLWALTFASLIPWVGSAQNSATQTPGAPKKTVAAPAQTRQHSQGTPSASWIQDLKKYPGLLPELSQLAQKFQQIIQSPAPRNASRLLPLLPESTTYYGALPNYGEVARQILVTFRQELQQSAVLRDWWTHGEIAANGPKIEQFLERLDLLNQFLGEEIVISGSKDAEQKSTSVLAVAEVRKPGLEKLLQAWLAEAGGAAKAGVQILDPQGLAKAPAVPLSKDLFVLIRPDYVVAASDLTALRAFNEKLQSRVAGQFAGTPFGQRIVQEYQTGVTLMGAADIHRAFLQNAVISKDNQQTFARSGFADMKYVIWKNSKIGDQSVSQGELSFSAPRHGAAAWLGKPVPLNSLNFVSSKSLVAFTIVLADLPQIYDDLQQLSSPTKTDAFAAIAGGEKALNLSLKQDLLAQLGGEITVAVDSLTPPQPAWRAIFQVKDAAHLQKTLDVLLAAAQLKPEHVDTEAFPYDVVRIPNQPKPMQIAYAFVDGYLILAASPDALVDAVRSRGSADSLAKSPKLLAGLLPGQPAAASGLFYQDPAGLFAPAMKQVAPDLEPTLTQLASGAPPSVVRFYGDESAIREVSSSRSVDATSMMIVAAIAIPNLIRSRMAANEASAVGSIRTVNTAQVTYASTYPKRGYAANLATLGPGPDDPPGVSKYSSEHAGLVDSTLANASCTGDAWCNKSGYQFRITTTGCTRLVPCKEYVAVATPANTNTGTRSFCSSADGVIHYKVGDPVTTSVTATQCRAWLPLR